jgi:DNA-directed RNA polymerase subunit RPC12/RpoP
MSTHYSFCEKCDLKVLTDKEALTKGIVCPSCGDRFSPKKLNRIDQAGRNVDGLATLAFIVGLVMVFLSFIKPDLIILASAVLGGGLTSFVIAQLLHIRAALERMQK